MSNHFSPKCRHFPDCSGCDSLNVRYGLQLKNKNALFAEKFTGFKSVQISPVTASHPPYYYRHKIQLPFGRKKAGRHMQIVLGLHNKKNTFVRDQQECMLQDAHLTAAAIGIKIWAREHKLTPYNEKTGQGQLRHVLLRKSAATGEILAGIITNTGFLQNRKDLVKDLVARVRAVLADEKNISVDKPQPVLAGLYENINTKKTRMVLGHQNRLLWGKPFITEKISGLQFELGLSTFFQVNPYQIVPLYDLVKNEILPGAVVADCYSGIASISQYIADKAEHVFSIEHNKEATVNAGRSLMTNHIKNVTVINTTAARGLQKILHHRPDTVVVDPPRTGLEPQMVNTLLRQPVNKIVYVSCDTETLVRDARQLGKVYHYEKVSPVDMFPHTPHIESVSVFVRKNDRRN